MFHAARGNTLEPLPFTNCHLPLLAVLGHGFNLVLDVGHVFRLGLLGIVELRGSRGPDTARSVLIGRTGKSLQLSLYSSQLLA